MDEFDKKSELGSVIRKFVDDNNLNEKGLSRDKQEAIEIYDIKIVTSEEEIEKLSNKSNFKIWEIYDENLEAILMERNKVSRLYKNYEKGCKGEVVFSCKYCIFTLRVSTET